MVGSAWAARAVSEGLNYYYINDYQIIPLDANCVVAAEQLAIGRGATVVVAGTFTHSLYCRVAPRFGTHDGAT